MNKFSDSLRILSKLQFFSVSDSLSEAGIMAFIAYNWNIENTNNDDLYIHNVQEDDISPPTEDLLFVDADNVQNVDDEFFYDDHDSDLGHSTE